MWYHTRTYQANCTDPLLECHVKIYGGGKGNRFGMNADTGVLGVWNPDHIGVFNILMVQHIQNGDSKLEGVAFDAMPVY